MPDSRPHIHLLASTRLIVSGRSVDRLPTRRLEALLGYLALHPGWQSRERIAEAIWPEQPEGKGTASLRNALSVLRRVLAPNGSTPALQSTRTQARLIQELCECDVREFQSAIAKTDFTSAVSIYAGDLLNDLHDEWIEPFRASLRERFHRALAQETDRLLRAGDAEGALQLADRWRKSDPWEREAVRVRLVALASTGRRQAALAELERLQAADEELLDLDPAKLRAEILEAIDRTQTVASAEASSNGSKPKEFAFRRLPAYLSRFFGRGEELKEVRRWIDGPSRLLSIVGTGGVGKTRLAVEASRQALERDIELEFVSLAGSDSEAGLLAALLDVLGLRESEGESSERALSAYLGRREAPLILVLDNLEQLVEPAAKVLVALTEAADCVKFLITSRETLGIEGEQLLALSPFQISTDEPAPSGESQPDMAVQMFVDRARNSRADFALTRRNWQDVAGLCRELEGLPLAIEIAASWSGALSVGEMRERVNDRRMVARKRGHDPRHQSLEACIDWSFNLLEPPTREFVCVLSLFRGGWTLQSCEAVTQAADAADLLAGLVDRSLVNLEETDVGLRFSMLESVRTFFRARLSDPSARTAAALMAAYFKEMAATHTNPCAGEQERINHRKLDRESENIEAIATLCEEGLVDVDLALGVVGGMQLHWTYRGQTSLGLSVVDRLLQMPGDKPQGPGTFLGLQARAVLLQDLGEFNRAEEAVEQMVAFADRQNDGESVFRALTQLGNVQSRVGRYSESLENQRVALEVALRLGVPRMEAVAHCNLAESLFGLGQIDESIENYRRSAELDQQNGNIAGEAALCLGFVQVLQGDLTTGMSNLARYFSNACALGFDRGIWRCVYFSALGAVRLCEAELGCQFRDAAVEMFERKKLVFDATERSWLALVDAALAAEGDEKPIRRVEPDEAIELVSRFLQTGSANP